MRLLDIGDVAARARMRPSALRYYEQIGLLPAAERIRGRRAFPATVVRRLALIKMLQRTGFSLAEIHELLATSTTTGATRQWRELAERKLPDLDRLIHDTQTLRQAVADCLACGCMRFDNCRLLNIPEPPPER